MKKKLVLVAMVFLIILGSCHAQSSNASTGFLTNRRTLQTLLAKTAPLNNGFYETSVGNNSDRVYGVAQCKANISSNACANCLNSSIESLNEPPEGTWVESLSTFCTLKFSDENFFGDWIDTTTTTFGVSGLDDSLAFSKGFSMMEGLAGTVPDQPLMYQGADVDVGDHGRRYGLAQCSRGLSKVNCGNCLEDGLSRYRSYVENRTGWEIIGISCSMWYGNVSVTDSPVFMGSTPAVTDTPGSMAPTPSQSQIPPGKPALTSGCQRCDGGTGFGIGTSLGIITLMLLASHQFHLA
ncbi:hypothetical protein L2E82_31199 [Cichorium intybus]|uniref:Uncharacterized protein n=1 Tax=Cichorium intybus TaxID=13427 RepID=A0ACB9D2P3_CICIN|nr:hypothetical protein L2E82_31199 [Cichorium intybus]